MTMKSHYFLLLLLYTLYLATTTLAQPVAAPAPAPGPPGPTNITKILEKAGQFTLFIRLMKSTAVADQINNQLNDSSNGMTVFAPSDSAFSSLSSGTLNSLNDQQKNALIQFHVIPSYLPMSQFQTVSNPLRTEAGDSSMYKYPLNVTSYGNSVNISTGITNTSVSGTVYTDGQLAVYQVDQVLLPWDLFGAKPPAPAPAPAKPKKGGADVADSSDDDDDDKVKTSGALNVKAALNDVLFFGLAMVAALFYSL